MTSEEFVCTDCIHKDYHDNGSVGCSNPYLYNRNGELIERRNERIATNMAKNKCHKKETKQTV